mmetsp:Transcript_81975/g.217245  ORF Transcript_81975/g.217245 Transcript_81975/m.217245 type:complete len:212 (+) Transcript_81975:93-728(+)
MLRVSARRLHSYLSFAVSMPILVSAITGAVWTIYKHWLGVKPPTWLMKWHQGDHWFGLMAPRDETFLVDDGSGPLPYLPLTRHWRYQYFFVLGMLTLMHLASGVWIVAATGKVSQRPGARRLHGLTAVVHVVPVLVTLVTGISYRLLRMHGYDHVKWLRALHAGYFGVALPVYPLAVCMAIVVLFGTGVRISPIARQLGRVVGATLHGKSQ